jgi:uncharacterized protein YycO
MKILGYKGRSVTSRLIQLQTRSPYSHIGVMLTDGSVIEAWQGTGVRQIPDPLHGHSKRTQIDVFDVTPDYREELVESFLCIQIGKKYDYSSVFRFVTRRNAIDNDKIFCSELAELAFISGGLRLLRGNPSHHSPRDTVLSPYLKFERTIK